MDWCYFLGIRTFCLIVVLGCLVAVPGFMNRPVIDDLWTILVLLFLPIVMFSFWHCGNCLILN